MHPVLFRFWVFEVTSYSAMLMLSFGAGAWLAARRAKPFGIDPGCIVRLSLYILAAAVIGARLAYGLVNYRTFPKNVLGLYHNGVVQISGLVMNGGLLLAVIVIWVYTAFHRLPRLRTMDAIAPSFALGIFFTRLGCFLNGCCFGRPTGLPWGVVFPAGTPAGEYQRMRQGGLVPIHPEQIYSALTGLAIFITLLVLERKRRRFDGETTFLALVLYALTRFMVEFFRSRDSDIDFHLALNHNQYASVLLFLAGAGWMAMLAIRSRAPGGPVPRNS